MSDLYWAVSAANAIYFVQVAVALQEAGLRRLSEGSDFEEEKSLA